MQGLGGKALLAIALVLGAAWRLADVGTAFLFGDELHSLSDLLGGLGHVLTTFSANGSGMALPILQSLSIDLFGAGHWTIRAPAWIAGLALLPLAFYVARRMAGPTAAAIATLLVAVDPMLIFYSRFARAYALVALLSLLLLDLVDRMVARPAESGARLAALILLTALLPYVHPIALGLVVPLYAGAIVAVAILDEGTRRARRLMLCLAGGGLLCIALHLPAWASLQAFVGTKTDVDYYGSFGFLDVATLLVGSRGLAWLAIVASLAAGVAWARARGVRGLPLLMACVGPGLTLALISPYGDAYAYARYAIPSIAPLCILLGTGIDALARRVAPSRKTAEWSALAAGALLAGLVVWLGPRGPGQPGHGPHANTYLALLPLPPFDRPWPEAPAFYRELASRPEADRESLRIVESPALTTRTRHLYRHYQQLHGVETWLAPFPGELPRIPAGPYVSLLNPAWPERAAPSFLVLHLDIAAEVRRYWDFVYGSDRAAVHDPDIAAYMERHARYVGPLVRPPAGWLAQLTARLGEPVYRDQELAVWALDEAARALIGAGDEASSRREEPRTRR